ncbi:MAG TPA: pyridoxamine 5'-phosphate oxidase family protein [Rhizomicrobium sp.]|nr:pyridoxamine 5'-phosphate oxidase family protein [Rhizomicrobium sp.]
MSREQAAKTVALLGAHRILTLATLRPDGWPQATIVGYANDGLRVYFMISRQSQKWTNLVRDPRVSIAIGADTKDPMAIDGLSMAARAVEVTDPGELGRARAAMLARYPEYAAWPESEILPMAMMRATPEIVSVLDYSKGFGHTELFRPEPDSVAAA